MEGITSLTIHEGLSAGPGGVVASLTIHEGCGTETVGSALAGGRHDSEGDLAAGLIVHQPAVVSGNSCVPHRARRFHRIRRATSRSIDDRYSTSIRSGARRSRRLGQDFFDEREARSRC